MQPYFNTGPRSIKKFRKCNQIEIWHKKHGRHNTTNGQHFMGSYQFSGFLRRWTTINKTLTWPSVPGEPFVCAPAPAPGPKHVPVVEWRSLRVLGRFPSNKLQNEFNYLSLNLKTICQSRKFGYIHGYAHSKSAFIPGSWREKKFKDYS